MGIRFDKDTRRATNGPIIFFSDPSAEISFSEEIRGAINSGLSFYSYRHPGDMMITFGSSEGFIEGLGTPGFVISKFDPSENFITIPYKGTGKSATSGISYKFPEKSTSYENYSNEVENIVTTLSKVTEGKTVAARVIVEKGSVDLGATFYELHKKYPQAYIFCFSTPATGCWIGASPELLLEAKKGALHTMALAGTRVALVTGDWDEKNIEEQRLVTDYILETFSRYSLNPREGKTFTKLAGHIEHICTPIEGDICKDRETFEKFLHDLSPTPALCGSPRDLALKLIKENENFSRGCYGGFCGPYHSLSDFTFNVVLRCASVTHLQYCIYAGGGITSRSVIDKEWAETEMKAQTFANSVITE